jgi:hypothetical protein
VAGLEIEMLGWEAERPAWRPDFTHWVKLTDESIAWLGTSHALEGKRILHTFLDDGFDRDWGESARVLEDAGRLVQQSDGTYQVPDLPPDPVHEQLVAGMFEGTIGERAFTCLRVIDVWTANRPTTELEQDILSECFYTQADELILFRRYNGRLWAVDSKGPYGGQPWDQRFPEHDRLVINGAMFVHWHDCLSGVSVGMA